MATLFSLVLPASVLAQSEGSAVVAAGENPDVRVVVIDPGHGGFDPGTTGITGIKEKDVALAVSLKLAEIQERDPLLEVHLTRTTDVYLHAWERGEIAMGMKGKRFGAFVSIHANAMPHDSVTKGFEVYFLSEARTEHERRVAAIENAPPPTAGVQNQVANDDQLDAILKELLNLDTHHWSSVLAESLRYGMAGTPRTHDLGVKQAPFAVITNTLMPGVLVELGYLTNRAEAERLVEDRHQRELALGIASGLYEFFERYPPGQGVGSGRAASRGVGRDPGE